MVSRRQVRKKGDGAISGDELKRRREALGLSQVEYARKLAVHPMSLSRFERGVEPVTVVLELATCELARRLESKASKNKSHD